jgi:hypothetical protein
VHESLSALFSIRIALNLCLDLLGLSDSQFTDSDLAAEFFDEEILGLQPALL